MPSLRSDATVCRLPWIAALLLTALLGGCIADTAEDSDLPWATNQGWEGMLPIPTGTMNRYD